MASTSKWEAAMIKATHQKLKENENSQAHAKVIKTCI